MCRICDDEPQRVHPRISFFPVSYMMYPFRTRSVSLGNTITATDDGSEVDGIHRQQKKSNNDIPFYSLTCDPNNIESFHFDRREKSMVSSLLSTFLLPVVSLSARTGFTSHQSATSGYYVSSEEAMAMLLGCCSSSCLLRVSSLLVLCSTCFLPSYRYNHHAPAAPTRIKEEREYWYILW